MNKALTLPDLDEGGGRMLDQDSRRMTDRAGSSVTTRTSKLRTLPSDRIGKKVQPAIACPTTRTTDSRSIPPKGKGAKALRAEGGLGRCPEPRTSHHRQAQQKVQKTHSCLAGAGRLGQTAPMAVRRRKVDRAQRLRSRGQWWARHGAFLRGVITGLAVSGLAAICVHFWIRS